MTRSGDGMTLRDYVRVVRDRWILVIVTVVVGLLAALGLYYVLPTQYTATVTLYVSAQATGGTQEAFEAAQLSAQRVTSYTQLATSPRVTSDAMRELGIDESPEQFATRLTATSALNSVLIDVSATGNSPTDSARTADAVATSLVSAVKELERPNAPNASPPVEVRLVQPAEVPDKPSSLGVRLLLALGLAAGLVLGVGIALLRNALDTSVRSGRALEKITGSPTLGEIARLPSSESVSLVAHEETYSVHSEAYRQIRTNLQFVDVDRPRKVILVTSSLPGEGKTTTVLNLAGVLAAAGSRVLIVDADLRRPRVAEALGLDDAVGLTTVLAGRTQFVHAVHSWSALVDVLPSGVQPPNPSEVLASQQMRNLLDQAKAHYDYVLLDSPPLLPVTDAAAVSHATDGAIVLCRYRTTRASQVSEAVAALRAVSSSLLGSVLTMTPPGSRSTYEYSGGSVRAVSAGGLAAGKPGSHYVHADPPNVGTRPSPHVRKSAESTREVSTSRGPAGTGR